MASGSTSDDVVGSLQRVIRSHIQVMKEDLHTAMPARILRYDPDTQMADVQPIINKLYTDNRQVPRAEIKNVPVQFLGSNRTTISFPLIAGDTGMVIFQERSIDSFLESDLTDVVVQSDRRQHDYSDAVFIPGLYSWKSCLNNPAKHGLKNLGTEDVVIKHNVGKDTENEFVLNGNGDVTVRNTKSFLRIMQTGIAELNVQNKFIVNCPETEWNGNITQIGNMDRTGTMTTTGDIWSTGGDVKSSTITLQTHVHIGSPTAPLGPISNTGLGV